MTSCQHVVDYCGRVAQSVLDGYVEHVALQATQLLQGEFLNACLPDPAHMWKQVFSLLELAQRDSVLLFGNDDEVEKLHEYPQDDTDSFSSVMRSRAPTLSHMKHKMRSHSISSSQMVPSSPPPPLMESVSFTSMPWLSSTIDKLFSQRVDIFTHVSVSRQGVLTALVRAVCKALVELVRCNHYTKRQVKQLVADLDVLKSKCVEYVGDDHVTMNLLNDARISIYKRCVDAID
jgi:hypothetical protein